jgi:hypothetical protein
VITTVYCSYHERCEEVAGVDEIHRFAVIALDEESGDSRPTGDWAVEVHGRLECGRAVHFIGSIGWWG